MAKVEIDIMDPLDNSGDGDEEILGMVDESYATNTVAYRLVMSPEEANGNSSLQTQTTYTSSAIGTNGQAQTIPAVLANSVNGQLYVIGNSDIFNSTTTKQSISRESHSKATTVIKKRDDRRRATHNEVERRRRDKINNWIMKLAKLIPRNDAVDKIGMESKGGILAKACDYIVEMKEHEERVVMLEKTNKKLTCEISALVAQYKTLKKANMQMKNILNQQGIIYEPESSETVS